MFNSRAFCIIVLLTAVVLGAAVYLQVAELQEYKLLTKLYNKYFVSASAGNEAAPAKVAKAPEKEPAKKNVKKK